MDIHFRKFCRSTLGLPPYIDWRLAWHEILHVWNQRVAHFARVDDIENGIEFAVVRIGHWRLILLNAPFTNGYEVFRIGIQFMGMARKRSVCAVRNKGIAPMNMHTNRWSNLMPQFVFRFFCAQSYQGHLKGINVYIVFLFSPVLFTGCLRAYRFHFTSLSRAFCFRNLPALVPIATWSFYQLKRLNLSKPSDRAHWPALWTALFEQGFLQHLISIYKGGYCAQPGEGVDNFGQSEHFRIRRCATRLRSQSTFI